MNSDELKKKGVGNIFHGSDGEATRQLYEFLGTKGPAGIVALNLFRACKNSGRAKVYRGGIPGKGSYKRMAYERKHWAMQNLCTILQEYAEILRIKWGWKEDPRQEKHRWVLYVEIPTGQVSFHTEIRGVGPDYQEEWDGVHSSDTKIIRWVEQLLT